MHIVVCCTITGFSDGTPCTHSGSSRELRDGWAAVDSSAVDNDSVVDIVRW